MTTPIKFAAGMSLIITCVDGAYAILAQDDNCAYLHKERHADPGPLLPVLNCLAAYLEAPSDLDNDHWTRVRLGPFDSGPPRL